MAHINILIILILAKLQLNFPSQGRVEHHQAEDGERQGGGHEEGGRERQTSCKKSSSDQHLARYEQHLSPEKQENLT